MNFLDEIKSEDNNVKLNSETVYEKPLVTLLPTHSQQIMRYCFESLVLTIQNKKKEKFKIMNFYLLTICEQALTLLQRQCPNIGGMEDTLKKNTTAWD